MHSHGGRRSRAPGIFIAGLAGASLILSGTAHAVTTPTEDANSFALAVANSSSGAFFFDYDCVADDATTVGVDESLCPTGISDTPMAGFPTSGSSYGILTSGNAAFADDADVSESTEYNWFREFPAEFGPDVWDAQVARVDMGTATTSCLAFDFRFFSEEYIEYVDKGFNDAFVAQLNTVSVTVDPATQLVNAPGNFAGGAGDVISVDSGGPSAMSDAHTPVDIGTTYDGATPLLTARIPVSPGTANSVFLTIFDQGDDRLDSAVFVDNMRYEDIDATKCKSLALDPYEGTTGVSPIAGNPPKLSKDKSTFTFPVSCNLPPGPVSCNVAGAASFVPTPGRNTSGRDASLLAATALASGSATIAPNTNGAITMATTDAGVAAIKAAIKKPAKLKAKAKKLLKKAKKLRAEGKIVKAKKLEKKAAKLIKRAKKLLKKPLGVITTTITNANNGVSASYKTILKRP